MSYNTFLFTFCFLVLINCNQNRSKNLREIKKINEYGDLSFILNTDNCIVIKRTYSFIEGNTVDSIFINLSKSDWNLLTESYFNNNIYSIKNNNIGIGENVNSIEFPERYTIITDKDTTNITYNYFLGENESIDEAKTKNFNHFMKVVDSIIDFRLQESKKGNSGDVSDMLIEK